MKEGNVCCKAFVESMFYVIRINCRILDCIPLYSRNIIDLGHATTLSNNYFIIKNITSSRKENQVENVTENMRCSDNASKCFLSMIFNFQLI